MTYADFLLLFLILPFIVLAIFLKRRLLDRHFLVLTGILTLIALVYMAPWDHIAAIWELWTWTNSQTWGLRWWAIPPEEYLFCILEAPHCLTEESYFERGECLMGNLTFQEISDPLTHRKVIRLWISYPPKLFSANNDSQKDQGV